MDRVTIRFTTQHGDFDTADRPILYVEGLDNGYVAQGEVGETAADYADRLVRDGFPLEVQEMLAKAGLLPQPLLSALTIVPEHVEGD